jgi:hypothetical protein
LNRILKLFKELCLPYTKTNKNAAVTLLPATLQETRHSICLLIGSQGQKSTISKISRNSSPKINSTPLAN